MSRLPHRTLAIGTIAASLAAAHAGDAAFPDDFWWWTGEGDFIDPANWNEGENALAPLAIRPASVGPAPLFVNGPPRGTASPTAPPRSASTT